MDFSKSNDLIFPPNFYGDILCMYRGSEESLKSYSFSCLENSYKLNCSKTDRPGKNEQFLPLSLLPRTQITSKMNIRHVVSCGRKTQIHWIWEVLKPAVKFRSSMHLTYNQVGGCFPLQINIPLNNFRAVSVVSYTHERVGLL